MNAIWKRALLLAAVCFFTYSLTPLSATRVCCEGEQWMHWTDEVRQTYVLAFSLGYSKGLEQGCDEGTRNSKKASRTGPENDPARSCRHKGLDFSRGTDHFVASVTEFYARFPADRDLYVEELLKCFANGLSVEETQKQHFPSRDKPPQ